MNCPDEHQHRSARVGWRREWRPASGWAGEDLSGKWQSTADHLRSPERSKRPVLQWLLGGVREVCVCGGGGGASPALLPPRWGMNPHIPGNETQIIKSKTTEPKSPDGGRPSTNKLTKFHRNVLLPSGIQGPDHGPWVCILSQSKLTIMAWLRNRMLIYIALCTFHLISNAFYIIS